MADDTDNSQPRSNRILVLPAAALVIAALTAYRMANPRHSSDVTDQPAVRRPAPPFQLYDQGGNGVEPRIVNLQSYLNRHTIVLAFYDGQKGPEANDILVRLREFYPALKREGVVVFGISTALPQENRNNSSKPFPFRLLSDVTATHAQSVHQVWGTLIPPPSPDQPAGTSPAVFVIDRAGLVAWEGTHPLPEESLETLIPRLLRG